MDLSECRLFNQQLFLVCMLKCPADRRLGKPFKHVLLVVLHFTNNDDK